MDRKAELKLQYKEMRPEMGVFVVRSNVSNKAHLEAVKDLKSRINRAKFQLGAGSHPNRELQKEWKELGADSFTIEILETLEYDKDESKTDYTEDLDTLQSLWEEKLSSEKIELYKG